MARRYDTGWRDGLLTRRHVTWGSPAPAAGMMLPMVEYDRGEPLAVIHYLRRGIELPAGPDVAVAYRAMGRLRRPTGEALPFFTAVYNPANWSFALLAHNEVGASFLDSMRWVYMTERQFVANLYRLRGRYLPDLEPYGVTFADAAWEGAPPLHSPVTKQPSEAWPGQDMSQRRREYEPVSQVRAGLRNPCLDVDLLVCSRDGLPELVVDYKAPGAKLDPTTFNLKTLAALHTTDRVGCDRNVPAMLVRYEPDPVSWRFRVHCLNRTARNLLAYTLGQGNNMAALADAVAGTEWTDLREHEWAAVLKTARDG